jgi:ketosteroid isomerase-like protein
VVALVLLAGIPATAQSKEEKAVRALLDRSFQAANTMDEKAWQQNLAEHSRSGGPFYATTGTPLATLAEVEKNVAQSRAQLASRKYSATSPPTVRADKNHAWAAYTWHAEVTLKDGTRHALDGRATVAFVREGKNWRIAHWHSSLASPPLLTRALLDAETARIVEIERSAWEALKNGQPERLADYFTDDASMFNSDQAYRVRGKAELLRGVQSWLQTTSVRSYQILDPQVQVMGDSALLTYYYTLSLASSGRDLTQGGKASVVFVKQGGTWRALHEHVSINR